MASPDERVFNIGIIGYGMSAKIFHIPFITLTKNLRLHTIVQRRPTPESSAPTDHPAVQHHTSVEPLLADPAVDLVVINTPPDTHFELASRVLSAGKHVLVEKPFVPSAAQADELIALARKQGKLICVYQNRRWDADFLTLKKLIGEGKLGRIYEFETHFDRYRPEKPTNWKATLGLDSGGGALFDLGTHLLDQVYVLFGMPTAAYAKLISQRDASFNAADPDSVNAVLSYDSTGLLVHVRIGVLSIEGQQLRFWARGDNGSYHKAGLDPQEDQLKAGARGFEPGFGREDEEWNGYLSVVKEDGKTCEDVPCPTAEPETYLEFYTLLGKALASGREEDLPVKAPEARDVLRIVEAVRRSAETGTEVKIQSSS